MTTLFLVNCWVFLLERLSVPNDIEKMSLIPVNRWTRQIQDAT